MKTNIVYNESCFNLFDYVEPASVDLIVTSPPYYNQRSYTDEDFDGKSSGVSAVKSKITLKEHLEEMEVIMSICYDALKKGGIIAWNVSDARETDLKSHHSLLLEQAEFEYQDTLVWDKCGAAGMRVKHVFSSLKYYPSFRHESIFIYRKGKPMLNKMDVDEPEKLKEDKLLTNLWSFPSIHNIKKTKHPAPFPVTLPKNVIRCYTKEGDIVMDPFSGIGSSCIAAAGLGRRYIGFEINGKYCEQSELNGVNVEYFDEHPTKQQKLI